jgi:prolyl-tRNA editing enzyme YbaK/EbsC (Cys-tRNA(Pro) deacylase)
MRRMTGSPGKSYFQDRNQIIDEDQSSEPCLNIDRNEARKIMDSRLRESARRVQDFLTAKGFPFEVKELSGSTRTAQEAADRVGCQVAQIAKSLVFKEERTDEPILVIASGSNRVDLEKIEKATGLRLGRADGNYVKDKVGFAIGGVPPAGHIRPLRTILDPGLKQYDTIWAAAGTPFAVFQLKPADLEPLTDGSWVDLSE